jgi:radical SAM protein with 4Fe4S-binding SPASM domain
LNKSEIISIAEEAVQKHNCQKIVFSGGEPFLRQDIFEIIDSLKVPVIIITNGTILNEKILNKLKKLNFDNRITEIRISYDGTKGQPLMRDEKSAEKVWMNILKMRDAGLPLIINTMITQSNLVDLKDLYETVVLKFNIPWLLDYPFNNGRWSEEHTNFEVKDKKQMFDNLQVIIEDYIKNQRHLEGKKIEIANYFSTNVILGGFYEMDKESHPCAYSFGAMTIKPNGDIGFCPTLDWIFGNIKNDSIESIPKKEKYIEWLSIKTKDVKACINCKYFRICGTGCRADAYYLTGDLYEKDYNACMFISNFHKRIIPLLSHKQQVEFDNLLNSEGFIPKY